jgi:membrane protein
MGTLISVLKRSFQSFGQDKCATLSAAIAYYTIFSLFPLALVGVSLLGVFVGDESAREQVVRGISGVISLGPDGEAALTSTLQGVHRSSGLIGLVGLAGALWSASGLFGALRSALNEVWDVDRPRPMLRAKFTDLILLIGFGGLLGASTASTGIVTAARETGAAWLGPLADASGPLFALLAFVAPLVLTFAAFMVLYKVAPHARLGWKDVIVSAVIATLFFEFGKGLLTYYIQNLGNFNALAGSLGAAILFLVFIYYASQVILLAAEVAKHIMLIRSGAVPATDPKAPGPSLPLGERVKRALVGLWSVGEHHHDDELPYAPSRLDPATNRPTNTREEVLYKQQQQQQSGQNGGTPAGAAAFQGDGRNGAAYPANGAHAANAANGAQPLDDRPWRPSARDEAESWRVAGFLLSIVAGGLLRMSRGRGAAETRRKDRAKAKARDNAARSRDDQRRADANPRLTGRPS